LKKSELKVMSPDLAGRFHHLYRVFPNPDDPTQDPPVTPEGNADLSVGVYGSNLADECDSENFDPICKATRLYITVSTDSLGGKIFGIELTPAYKWRLTRVIYKPACAELRLLRREVQQVGKAQRWIERSHTICVAPTGVVEQAANS
jgi:hypothetical protein